MCIRDRSLQEHVYIKDANRKVRKCIKQCHICQLVTPTVSNDRKEGTMIPITTSCKLEKVFVDICGPFPRSGGRHQYKYLVIVFDHYTRFTKLYPINRNTTQKILNLILLPYISEVLPYPNASSLTMERNLRGINGRTLC